MYSPPPFTRSSGLPSSNSLYTFKRSPNNSTNSRSYLESCANIMTGQREYQVEFLAKNNCTYKLTHLAFVLGNGVLSYKTSLKDYVPKNLDLEVRKVRPSLYFEFGKDVKPDQKIVISPCESMAPSLLPLENTLGSPGLRSKGVSKVKPLAGIQQTWALIFTSGSFNIRPGLELIFAHTPGLEIKFPSLLDEQFIGSGTELNAPAIKFHASKDEKFSLEIMNEIPSYHTLIIPCQFYVNSQNSTKNITKIKATPHTFDHKIEIFLPWERSRITQNLRFYQPFTVGHSVHSCGSDKKYVQLLVKCRTNEISFQLSQPELKFLNKFKEFETIRLSNLNNTQEIIKITGNQSASYVWLLNSQTLPQNDKERQLNGKDNSDFGGNKDALQKAKLSRGQINSTRLFLPSIDDRLDLAFTIRYIKCQHQHQLTSPKVEQTSYTYLFDLVLFRNQFLVRTVLVPPLLGTTEDRASFLKVETPCTFTAQIYRVASGSDTDVYLKCRIICDPAVWAIVGHDGTQPSDEDIIKVGSDPHLPATFSKVIRPLTRGYFPAPAVRLYILDERSRSGEVANYRQSAIADFRLNDPLKSPLLAIASRLRTRTESGSLTSFYRKCSTPFKHKTRSLSKDASQQESQTASNPKNTHRDSQNFEKVSKAITLINLGPAQVYNASLGIQYQVLPPNPG